MSASCFRLVPCSVDGVCASGVVVVAGGGGCGDGVPGSVCLVSGRCVEVFGRARFAEVVLLLLIVLSPLGGSCWCRC